MHALAYLLSVMKENLCRAARIPGVGPIIRLERSSASIHFASVYSPKQ